MILILGGTTEGRLAAKVCDEAAKPFFYSTKGSQQEISFAHGTRLSGGFDEQTMAQFCTEHQIRLMVDAAHPFAELLHHTVAKVSLQLDIPVIRLERSYPRQDENLIWCDSYQDAVDYLLANNIPNLLALTGTNTIVKLKGYWQQHPTRFRILDREESREIARLHGFPLDNLLYYNPDDDETELFRNLRPAAIITKESGGSGGFNEKVAAARSLNIPTLVVKRPPLAQHFVSVYGEHGLRKTIEKLLPDFFALRTGYTTGSCATAATKAALTALLSGYHPQEVSITLPNGEWVHLPVAWVETASGEASACVVKDAGDDPDVIHGHEIVSTVKLNEHHKGVRFLQGKGVGTVTLPGLDIAIGEPAINATPRQMMKREIFKVMRHHPETLPNGLKTGVDVTISVPQGEQLASKTFNPKIGIVGGISIIGTSGIVKPFSSEAFVAAIRREMQVAKALSNTHVVINSGAKSERFVKAKYPHLPSQAFVHYGNFIGETIKTASELGFTHISMGIMLGKAVKLAEGNLDTHSKKVVMNRPFLRSLATEAGWDDSRLQQIDSINLARQLWDIAPSRADAFFRLVIEACVRTCSPLLSPTTSLEVLLIDEEGNVVA